MAIKPLQASADKYGQNGGAAGQFWQQGAANFSGDPTALAAAAGTKAQQRYQEAWTSGRIQQGLAQAGKQGWLAGINDPNAVSAYQNGVSGKGKAKWQKSMTPWWPVFQNAQNQIDAMPNNTDADAEARALTWMRTLRAAKQSGV